jgi:glyceraldehyde 3-phosphate dehydrogenase
MSIRVGINGLGRIGRAIIRNNLEKEFFNIVCINDINPDINNIAYLLKFDTTYGKLKDKVDVNGKNLTLNGKNIAIHSEKNIHDVPWNEYDVDIVIDSSGVDSNLHNARLLKDLNVKKYICTNSPPTDKVDKTLIMGVNENTINMDKDFVIASSICDANAFVPVALVLEQEFGIEHGFLTTLHPWLGYQNLLDGPSASYSSPGEIHDHYALGRSSFGTLIPKTTSAVSASIKCLKSLEGKFSSFSYRVPTMVVGSADISIKLSNETTTKAVKKLFMDKASEQNYKIYHNNNKNLISSDFIGSDYSVIIDHRWLNVNKSNYVKIVLWYDNEWGYSARVVDLTKYIGDKI